MSPLTIVLTVILVLVIAACIALYIFGKKAEKKQAAQKKAGQDSDLALKGGKAE